MFGPRAARPLWLPCSLLALGSAPAAPAQRARRPVAAGRGSSAGNASASWLRGEIRQQVRRAVAAEMVGVMDQLGHSLRAVDYGMARLAQGLHSTQGAVAGAVDEAESLGGRRMGALKDVVEQHLQALQVRMQAAEEQVAVLHGLVRSLAPSPSAYRQAVFEEIYAAGRWGSAGGGSGGGSDITTTAPLRAKMLQVLERWDVDLVLDIGCGSLAWVPELLADAEDRGRRPRYCGADLARPLVEAHRTAWRAHPASKAMRFVVADAADAEGWAALLAGCGLQEEDSLADSMRPQTTLVLCRDVLQHMSFTEARSTLRHIASIGRSASHRVLALLSSHPGTAANADLPAEAEHPLLFRHQAADASRGTLGGPPHNLRLPPFSLPVPLQALEEETTGKVLLLYSAGDLWAADT